MVLLAKMADGKSAEDVSKNLGKALQKTVRRTKEKVILNSCYLTNLCFMQFKKQS